MATVAAIACETETPKLTEWSVQNSVATEMRARGHGMIVPNTQLYYWEADLISVTQADFVHEYEIKVDRIDYRNEIRASKRPPGRGASTCKFNRHRSMQERQNGSIRPCANYFWFVAPRHFIDEFGIPEYAGLIVPRIDGPRIFVDTAIKAPRLHTEKISDKHRAYLARGLEARYWRTRLPELSQ